MVAGHIVKKDTKILVALSGGIDSTAMLYHFLRNTEAIIHVHHVQLQNINYENPATRNLNRHLAEREAVKRIIKYCKSNLRDFDYSSSVFSIPTHKSFPDIICVGFMVAQVLFDHPMDIIAFGGISDEPYANFPEPHPFLMGLREQEREQLIRFIFRQNGWYQNWRKICRPDQLDIESGIGKIYQPLKHMTKKECMEVLPEDLLRVTSSCRNPIIEESNIKRCMRCLTCEQITVIDEHYVGIDSYAKEISGNTSDWS